MARNQRALSRRSFCSALAGVLVTPGIALAQAPKVVRRIGVLEPGAPNPDGERVQAEALREAGWVEGQNLRVERRYANERSEALQALAEELVRAKVEIIVIAGTRPLHSPRSVQLAPFQSLFGPRVIRSPPAWSPSLARPGSNVTGYSDHGRAVKRRCSPTMPARSDGSPHRTARLNSNAVSTTRPSDDRASFAVALYRVGRDTAADLPQPDQVHWKQYQVEYPNGHQPKGDAVREERHIACHRDDSQVQDIFHAKGRDHQASGKKTNSIPSVHRIRRLSRWPLLLGAVTTPQPNVWLVLAARRRRDIALIQ